LIVAFAIAVAAAVLGLGACSVSDRRPVPTNVPGAGGFDALIIGHLKADPFRESGCVWLETRDGPMSIIWPHGYSARFGPVAEVLDENGHVVARAGEEVTFTGGIGTEFTPSFCRVSQISVLVYEVNQPPSPPSDGRGAP
jgi:hypothetical protein